MKRGLSKYFILLTIIAIIAVVVCVLKGQLVAAVLIGLLPIIVLILFLSIEKKSWALMMLMLISYFIPTFYHYVHGLKLGSIVDLMILFNALVIATNMLTKSVSLKRVSWDVIFIIGIWTFYCFMEVFNPRMINVEDWLLGMRSMSLYFLCIYFLTEISLEKIEDVKSVIVLWSVLSLIAALKSLYQKYVGFTPGDLYFLTHGGARTHIIMFGIRYFSIFTDAANFGGAMGVATPVFLIMGFHSKKRFVRWYYWIVSILSCYGMILSGTRSALAAPIAGILLYLALIRDWKKMIPVALILGVVIGILAFTTIGDSLAYVRRARTIFHREEDASYVGRKMNQEKLREIMKTIPFGNGLNMSGGKGARRGDESELAKIPTDSQYVQVWVETGIIGVTLFFIVFLYIMGKGAFMIMFRIKDPEIKGMAAGLLAGTAGLFVMSSNNEVFTQIPNGQIVYISLAMIMLCEKFDRELQEKKKAEIPAPAPDEQ